MKYKKLTSLMLATAVTASLLSGCGGGSDAGSSTSDSGSAKTEEGGGKNGQFQL